jgi:putative membrane protein
VTRTAIVLLSLGVALFVALVAWQGVDAVGAVLRIAGWSLLLVAAFHALPLLIDAAAIRVLLDGTRSPSSLARATVLARWGGESVNSLLPAGQIGGPVLMTRHLTQHGVAARDAVAAITVSTTLQTVTQVLFLFSGLVVFGVFAAHGLPVGLRDAAWIAGLVLALASLAFFLAQRRGLFGHVLRIASRLTGRRDWSSHAFEADAMDLAVNDLYREPRRVVASLVLNFAGWLVGTGEVWLALHFLGHPVGWLEALLLESVGQAVRGAAFAIPGSLGVQEGGYLLLAPIVGLPLETALALSLAKRARELAWALPGIVYLHFNERHWRRRDARVSAVH